MTVVFIEHDMDVVRRDQRLGRVYGPGEIIAEGTSAQIGREPGRDRRLSRGSSRDRTMT